MSVAKHIKVVLSKWKHIKLHLLMTFCLCSTILMKIITREGETEERSRRSDGGGVGELKVYISFFFASSKAETKNCNMQSVTVAGANRSHAWQVGGGENEPCRDSLSYFVVIFFFLPGVFSLGLTRGGFFMTNDTCLARLGGVTHQWSVGFYPPLPVSLTPLPSP